MSVKATEDDLLQLASGEVRKVMPKAAEFVYTLLNDPERAQLIPASSKTGRLADVWLQGHKSEDDGRPCGTLVNLGGCADSIGESTGVFSTYRDGDIRGTKFGGLSFRAPKDDFKIIVERWPGSDSFGLHVTVPVSVGRKPMMHGRDGVMVAAAAMLYREVKTAVFSRSDLSDAELCDAIKAAMALRAANVPPLELIRSLQVAIPEKEIVPTLDEVEGGLQDMLATIRRITSGGVSEEPGCRNKDDEAEDGIVDEGPTGPRL